MKKHIIIFSILCIVLALILAGCTANKETVAKEKVVTSFYPMYIMALNIMHDVPEYTLENMTDSTIGCLHDYTLQTADLKKVESAKVFIRNGMGLETFMNKITENYANLKIIDTSEAGVETLEDDEGLNGHIWNSMDNYKKQVQYICDKMSEFDSKNADKYKANTKNYIDRLNEIDTYKGHEESVISCNESLAYLLDDANLEVIDVYTDHDNSNLSSGKIAEIVEKAKDRNIKAVFIDKNDNPKNADLIANEIGAKVVKLDSCLTGDMNKDAYINAMQNNYNKLREIIE